MPSLLSISRGGASSSSIIRNVVKLHPLDASSAHRRSMTLHSHLSRASMSNNGCRALSVSLNSSYSRDKSSAISLGGIRSMSAAARTNDSSSKRMDPSLATPSTKYNKGTKQSAGDTGKKSTTRVNDNKQRSTDWRAWFSSTEYDDPWSPYRPFSQQLQQQMSSNTSNTTSNSQSIVDNILTNYNDWKRRKHGMNLVPLSLVHLNDDSNLASPNTQHTTTNTDNNNTIQQTPTTTNNTSLQTIIKLQKRTEWIDTQTRFTIQMLHDLYSTGIRRQMDRPTVERCHRMIGRLLSLTPRDGNVVLADDGSGEDSVFNDDGTEGIGAQISNGNHQTAVEITGAAQRGNAILERMEGCSPAFLPQLRKWQRQQELQQRRERQKQQHSGSGFDSLFLQDASSTAEQSRAELDVAYHNTNKVPNHLIQTKQAIPTPTRAIYNMVLLLYGKEAGPGYVAEQAEDVVWGMIVRGLQLEEFNLSHDIIDEGSGSGNTTMTTDGGGEGVSTPLYPNTQNWNCVLQCWSNSTNPNRAFFAYSFFKAWMEWNDRSREKVVVVGEGTRSCCCDLQSFHWMVKACLVDETTMLDDEDDSDSDTSQKVLLQRAKEIGSRVAIGIWRDMRTWRDQNGGENTLTLEMYEQLLQALCQTTDRSRGLLAAVAAVFQSCRSDGMETKQIEDLVRGVMTESQFQKLLRSEKMPASKN